MMSNRPNCKESKIWQFSRLGCFESIREKRTGDFRKSALGALSENSTFRVEIFSRKSARPWALFWKTWALFRKRSQILKSAVGPKKERPWAVFRKFSERAPMGALSGGRSFGNPR